MARQYSVLEIDGSNRGARCKKSLALLMIRRLVAVQVADFVIRRVPIRELPPELPRLPLPAKTFRPKKYEHHIEPRIELLNVGNSEWIAYLQGFRKCSEAEL